MAQVDEVFSDAEGIWKISSTPAPAADRAAATQQAVQTILDHHRRYRGDLDHLMEQRCGILSLQQASGWWCSITSSTCSIGNSFGPDPGWPG